MDSGPLVTAENAGPFSVLYEMGPDLMSQWMRSFLPYEARLRMLMLNRGTRAWMLKHCRLFCNDMDYGKLLRQRLYNFPLTARVACVPVSHLAGEQRYYGARDFMTNMMNTHTPAGDRSGFEYHTNMAFLTTEFSVFEAVLHPTSDYPFIDNVRACYALADPTLNTVPPVFFKFDALHSSTRRHGVVSSNSPSPSRLPVSTLRGSTLDDTPLAGGMGKLLESVCLSQFDVNNPILVILNTSLAHTLALQGRSWMTYAAKMRSLRHDDDLEAQLRSSADLAIRGTFAYTGRMTVENKQTKRLQTMIFLDYITRSMSDTVHCVG